MLALPPSGTFSSLHPQRSYPLNVLNRFEELKAFEKPKSTEDTVPS